MEPATQNISVAVRDRRVRRKWPPIAQIGGEEKIREIRIECGDESRSRGERRLKRRVRRKSFGIGVAADDHCARSIDRDAGRRIRQFAAQQSRGQQMGKAAIPLRHESIQPAAGWCLIGKRRNSRLRSRLEGSRCGGKARCLRTVRARNVHIGIGIQRQCRNAAEPGLDRRGQHRRTCGIQLHHARAGAGRGNDARVELPRRSRHCRPRPPPAPAPPPRCSSDCRWGHRWSRSDRCPWR